MSFSKVITTALVIVRPRVPCHSSQQAICCANLVFDVIYVLISGLQALVLKRSEIQPVEQHWLKTILNLIKQRKTNQCHGFLVVIGLLYREGFSLIFIETCHLDLSKLLFETFLQRNMNLQVLLQYCIILVSLQIFSSSINLLNEVSKPCLASYNL